MGSLAEVRVPVGLETTGVGVRQGTLQRSGDTEPVHSTECRSATTVHTCIEDCHGNASKTYEGGRRLCHKW